MDQELIEKMLSGKMIDEIAEKMTWKDFESLVEDIFGANFFKTKKNFRFKTEKRFEVDLIAIKDQVVFCVDCKHWKRGREKRYGLRNAAKLQEKRLKEFKKFLRKNLIAKRMFKIKNQNFVPMVVSLYQEDLIREGETLFVPLWKLNYFLVQPENFL